MGTKKAYTLLSGATGTGAGSAVNVGQYQKAGYFEVNTTSGTAAFTIALQYKSPTSGSWESFHSEAVTTSTDDPLIVKLAEFPWDNVRANITAYTSGTVSVWAQFV